MALASWPWVQMATINPLFSLAGPDHLGTYVVLLRYYAFRSSNVGINLVLGAPVIALAVYAGIGLLCRFRSALTVAAVTSIFTLLDWPGVLFFQRNHFQASQVFFTPEQVKTYFVPALLFNLVIVCYVLNSEAVKLAFLPKPIEPRRNF